MEKGKLV